MNMQQSLLVEEAPDRVFVPTYPLNYKKTSTLIEWIQCNIDWLSWYLSEVLKESMSGQVRAAYGKY